MDSDSNPRKYIEALARDTLQRFDEIADSASHELRDRVRRGSDVLVYPTPRGKKQVEKASRAVSEAARQVQREPAIARVLIDDNGRRRVWYICRAAPPSIGGVASYRSPIGRMASLQVGSEFVLPKGNTVVILEQTQFRPSKGPDGWDSAPTVVTTEHFDPITVDSLRAFAHEPEISNILDQILADEQARAGIVEGIRRHVIERMSLRDHCCPTFSAPQQHLRVRGTRWRGRHEQLHQ